METSVSLVKCLTYEPKELYDAVKRSVELAGGLEVQGKSVLLKPNILSDSDPAKAITTHPEFIRAVVRVMKESGASEIYIGDSPGLQKPGYSGKKSGIRQVADETGCLWVDFTKDKTVIRNENGKLMKEFRVAAVVDKVDMVISLPKLKTHHLMYFTGAVKNLFGLLPGLSKSPLHVTYPTRYSFGEMLLDLLEAVKPSFSIMDAVIGMEGPGPGNGYPRPVQLILASPSAVALDITACRIIGYDPMSVTTNKLALKRNLEIRSASDISVKGLSVSEVRIPDYKLIPEKKFQNIVFDLFHFRVFENLQQKFKPKPVFSRTKCIECGECIKICASDALEFEKDSEGRFVSVDYKKCIRCYCCHEICPADAITIE